MRLSVGPFKLLSTAVFAAIVTMSPASALGLAAPQREPLETAHSGWLWSDPFPQGNTLENVSFAGKSGFAVGEEGTVLRSLDGGLTWTTAPSGTTAKLSLVQTLDARTVIVGGECSLRESQDGGRSFTRIAFDRSEEACGTSLRSFSFLDARSGFVETEGSGPQDEDLLWTDNGGASFEPRSLPPLLHAAKKGPVKFISPSVGVVAINGGEPAGQIWRTTDGARSWSQVASSTEPLAAITFVTPLVGYAVGEKDTMLRTEDGGQTWRSMGLQLPARTPVRDLLDISCAGIDTCLMAAAASGSYSSTIMRTTDGGLTGQPTSAFVGSSANLWVLAVASTQPGSAVAVGSDGATSVSDDGGTTFATQASETVDFGDVFEQARIRLGASPLEAYIPAEYGRLARTKDGGLSWELLRIHTNKQVLDAAFPSSRTGFALVHGGAVYDTENGGRSWSKCGSAGRAPGALIAASTRTVIVTSARGIWRSTNGCQSFQHIHEQVPRGTGRDEQALSGFELEYGGAERIGGTVVAFGLHQLLESTDGGASWRAIPNPPVEGNIECISFLNANTGYVLLEGRLYFTRDAGRSWHEILSLPANATAEPPAMSFSSVAKGYVATRYPYEESGNIVFRTEDSGRTWLPEEIPNRIGAVTAVGNLAYAASEGGGYVYVTRHGGLAGRRSHITLAISGSARRSHQEIRRRHEMVSVHGRLTPAVAGSEVVISWLSSGGSWQTENATVDSKGRFSLEAQQVTGTTWFVANWNGDDVYRGAGSGSVKLTVRG